jgi:adenosylcobinamide-GDP ribazoletransferase
MMLLTRLPMRLAGPPRGAATAWAWPLVGALVGAAGAAAGALALAVGLAPALAAVTVLAVQMLLTGALHEDGLADSADGLWGGADRQQRLEIMKDSRIGSYGVLALILGTLGRWAAIGMLAAAGDWAALLAAGAISRAPMAVLMAALPAARPGGLSQGIGRPGRRAVLLALALAAGFGLAAMGLSVLPALAAAALAAALLGRLALSRIGGQTGDILGASQQLSELAVLAVATAALAP